jgi:hypothetical protein
MHLSEIARELMITTQELRHELAKTNFGISPTAHEVEDTLAKGIIRFLKGKIKPTLKARKVTVIYKEGAEKKKKEKVKEDEKEEGREEKKPAPKRAMTKKEKEEIERKAKEEEEKRLGIVHKEERRTVPKTAPDARADVGSALHVSRRIEIGAGGKTVPAHELAKTYYRPKKKKRKKGKGEEEEKILLTMQRHPGRKMRIAKVSYQEDQLKDDVSAEAVAIERQLDREHFRAQKKQRAISQKRGPKEQPQIKAKTGVVEIPSIISLKEFSEKTGLPISEVISTLLKNGHHKPDPGL